MTKNGSFASLKPTLSLLSVFRCYATPMAQTPLFHGIYVTKFSRCTDAPDTAITVCDGVGFRALNQADAPRTSRIYQTARIALRACTAVGDWNTKLPSYILRGHNDSQTLIV